jgi:hypothetical protein
MFGSKVLVFMLKGKKGQELAAINKQSGVLPSNTLVTAKLQQLIRQGFALVPSGSKVGSQL